MEEEGSNLQSHQHHHHHLTQPNSIHKPSIESTSTSPVNGPSLVKIASSNGNGSNYSYSYIYNPPPPSASSGMSNHNLNSHPHHPSPYTSTHHSNSTVSSISSPGMSSDVFSNRSTSSLSSGGGGGTMNGHSRSDSRSHTANGNPTGTNQSGGQSGRRGRLSTRTSFSSLDIGEEIVSSSQEREVPSSSDRDPPSSSVRRSWKSSSKGGSAGRNSSSGNGIVPGNQGWGTTPYLDEEKDEFIHFDSSFDSTSSTPNDDEEEPKSNHSSSEFSREKPVSSPSGSEARELNDDTPTPGQRPTLGSESKLSSFTIPKRREGSDASTFIDKERKTSRTSSRNQSVSDITPVPSSSHHGESKFHSRNESLQKNGSEVSIDSNSNSSKSVSSSMDSSLSSFKNQTSATSNHSSSSSSKPKPACQPTSTWADPPLSAPLPSSNSSSSSRSNLTPGEREMLSALNAQLEKCPSREDLPNESSSSSGGSSHFRRGSRGRNAGFWDGGGSDEPFEYKDGYGFTRVDNSHAFASPMSGERSRSNSFGLAASANAVLGLRRRSSELTLGAARKAIDATKRSMGMLRKRESGTWETVDPETGLQSRISRRSSNNNSRSGSFSVIDSEGNSPILETNDEKSSLEEYWEGRSIEFDHISPSSIRISRTPPFSKLSSISSKVSRLSKRATSVDLGLDLRNSGSNFKLSKPNLSKKRSSQEIIPPSPTSPRVSHGRSMSFSRVSSIRFGSGKDGDHSRSNSNLNLADLKISSPIGPVTSAIPGSPSPSTISFSQVEMNPLSSSSQAPPSATPRKFSFAQGQGMLSQVWETDAERERMSPSGSGEVEGELTRSISQQSFRLHKDQQQHQEEEPAPSSVLLDGRPFPSSPLPMSIQPEEMDPELNLPTSSAMSRNISNAESSVDSLASSVSDLSPINSIEPPLAEGASSLWETKPENIFNPAVSFKPNISTDFETSESPRSGPVLVGREKLKSREVRNQEEELSSISTKELGTRRPSGNPNKFNHSRGTSSSLQAFQAQAIASQKAEQSKSVDPSESSRRNEPGLVYEKVKSSSSTALEKQSGSNLPALEVRRDSESSAQAKTSSVSQSQAQNLAQTYARTHSRLPSSTSLSAPKSLAKKSYNALLNLLAQGSPSSISSSSISNPIPAIPNFNIPYSNFTPTTSSFPKAIESHAAPSDSGSASTNGGGFNGALGGGGGGWDGNASNFSLSSNGISSFGGGGIGNGSGSGGSGGNGNPNGNPSNPLHSSAAVQNIFRRLELIGRGAYGAVYRGVHVASGTAVALKVVNLDTPEDDVSDIQKEVAVLSQLREPDQKNVVRYWGCWLTGYELWIVMDFAEGGSIRTLMKSGPIQEKYIVLIIRESLTALTYLHKQGIIHRDIKAANILLTNSGKILVCDFGVAASLASSSVHAKRSTFVGTPYWMAPEVITKGKTYNQGADIWSLGITVYEIATGNPPLADQEQMRAIMLIPKNKPPRLPADGNFSMLMRDFVASCLNEEPGERPTAEELAKSKWIKNSARTPNTLLKELIQQYIGWTKSGGMRMSLLGAEAAELGEAGNRDSFAFDGRESDDGWEFNTLRSQLQPDLDDDDENSLQPSSAPLRDHPLLRLFDNGDTSPETRQGALVAPPSSTYEMPSYPPSPPLTATSGPTTLAPVTVTAAPSSSSSGTNPSNAAGTFAGTGNTPFRFGGGPNSSTKELSSGATIRAERPAPIMIPSQVSDHTTPLTGSTGPPTANTLKSGQSLRQASVDSDGSQPTPVDLSFADSSVVSHSTGFGSNGTSITSTTPSVQGHRSQLSGTSRSLLAHRRDPSSISNVSSKSQSPALEQGAFKPYGRKGSLPTSDLIPAMPTQERKDSSPFAHNVTGLEQQHLSDQETAPFPFSGGGRFTPTTSRPGTSDSIATSAPSTGSGVRAALLGNNSSSTTTTTTKNSPRPTYNQGSRSVSGPGANFGSSGANAEISSRSFSTNHQGTRDLMKLPSNPYDLPSSVSAAARGGELLPPSPASASFTMLNNRFLPQSNSSTVGVPSPLGLGSNRLSVHQRQQHGGSDPTMPGNSNSQIRNSRNLIGGDLSRSGSITRRRERESVLEGSWAEENMPEGPLLRPLDLSELITKEEVHNELNRTVEELGIWLEVLGTGLGRAINAEM